MWQCISDVFLAADKECCASIWAVLSIHCSCVTGVISPLFPFYWCFQSLFPFYWWYWSVIPILLVFSIHYYHFSRVIHPFLCACSCVCVCVCVNVCVCVCLCVWRLLAQWPACCVCALHQKKTKQFQSKKKRSLSYGLSLCLTVCVSFQLAVCTAACLSVISSLYLPPCLSTTCQSWGIGSWQCVHFDCWLPFRWTAGGSIGFHQRYLVSMHVLLITAAGCPLYGTK